MSAASHRQHFTNPIARVCFALFMAVLAKSGLSADTLAVAPLIEAHVENRIHVRYFGLSPGDPQQPAMREAQATGQHILICSYLVGDNKHTRIHWFRRLRDDVKNAILAYLPGDHVLKTVGSPKSECPALDKYPPHSYYDNSAAGQRSGRLEVQAIFGHEALVIPPGVIERIKAAHKDPEQQVQDAIRYTVLAMRHRARNPHGGLPYPDLGLFNDLPEDQQLALKLRTMQWMTNHPTCDPRLSDGKEQYHCDSSIYLKPLKTSIPFSDFRDIDSISALSDTQRQALLAWDADEAQYYGWMAAINPDEYVETIYTHNRKLSAGAIRKLERLAEGGNADARYRLGVALSTPSFLPPDIPRSKTLFKKAADAGHAAAQRKMGLLALLGKSDKAARQWLTKAVENGDNDAIQHLYSIERARSATTPTIPLEGLSSFTVKALTKAATANPADPMAQYLSAIELLRKNTDRARISAKTLALNAAKRSLPEAEFLLGQLYEKGIGVKRDLDTAELWYKSASQTYDAGFADVARTAQYAARNLSRDEYYAKKSGRKFDWDNEADRTNALIGIGAATFIGLTVYAIATADNDGGSGQRRNHANASPSKNIFCESLRDSRPLTSSNMEFWAAAAMAGCSPF